jgi:hypothetical protein
VTVYDVTGLSLYNSHTYYGLINDLLFETKKPYHYGLILEALSSKVCDVVSHNDNIMITSVVLTIYRHKCDNTRLNY